MIFKSMAVLDLLIITLGATAQQSIQHEPVPMPSSELRKFHSEIMDMAAVLESRNYPDLKVSTSVFEGEWHVSACAASAMRVFINLYGE